MHPRLAVQVLCDFSAPRIVDVRSKKIRTWKGKAKLKKLDLSECEEKLEDHDASIPIKHLVAKKFASIVPKRNVQVPEIVAKPKVIKLLHKSSRPKSLGFYRQVNAEEIGSQEKTTLEMLIPPSENFHGFTNPFSSEFKGTCFVKSNKLASSDSNVNDQNNNRKVGRKKVSVKGRMKMENGTMKYFAESQLPFSAKSTTEKVSQESSFEIHDQVQRNIDVIDEDMLVNNDESVTYATSFEKEDSAKVTDVYMLENNGDERLFKRNNYILDQMNIQVWDENMAVGNGVFNKSSTEKDDPFQVQVNRVLKDMRVDKFLCDHCPAMLNSHESFEKHVETNCGQPSEKVLVERPTLVKAINDSEKHEESPLGGKLTKQFLCDNCPTFFDSVDSLAMHMESHSKTTQSLCDQCPTLWYSRENLKSHCESMHTPNSRENLKSHCDRMHTTNYRQNLKYHYDRMHTPNSKENLKPNCERMHSLTSRENLKPNCDEMYTPNSRENLKPNCDGMYTPNNIDRPGSKTFEDDTHGEMTKKVSCGFCSKSFKNKRILKIHVRGDCGEEELRYDKRKSGENAPCFLCNICQRCFYDKRGLNLHKLVHSRKKSYRKSSRILAKNLDSGESNKRILYSKTSTYKYQKEMSEYYNKDEKLICAKSSKKYKKCLTTWRGKGKKNESTVSVEKYKETRMDVKMEETDFMKNKRKSSRTSELKEKLIPKIKDSRRLLNKVNDLGKNMDGHHDGIEIGKNDNPDESLEIELIEITSDDEEKNLLMVTRKSELITTEDENDKVPFNAEPELIEIED